MTQEHEQEQTMEEFSEQYARRAIGTMLAALRFWQHTISSGQAPPRFLEIATDGGTVEPLTPDEIDQVCEDINHNEENEVLGDAG